MLENDGRPGLSRLVFHPDAGLLGRARGRSHRPNPSLLREIPGAHRLAIAGLCLLLFVQLPAAIWIMVARPELKWGAVIAVNATAFVTGGPLFVMLRHVKKRNQSMPPNRQEQI
jgi:hypothetical protein